MPWFGPLVVLASPFSGFSQVVNLQTLKIVFPEKKHVVVPSNINILAGLKLKQEARANLHKDIGMVKDAV